MTQLYHAQPTNAERKMFLDFETLIFGVKGGLAALLIFQVHERRLK